MRNAFQTRILAVALALATLGVCVLAGFNLSQELSVQFPTDGVVWIEAQGGDADESALERAKDVDRPVPSRHVRAKIPR